MLSLLFILGSSQIPNEIFMESWKKGKDQVQEEKILVEVNSKSSQYSKIVKNKSGKARYKLVCEPIYNQANLVQYWKIFLRQNGVFSKDNLLQVYSSDDHYILNYDDGSPIYLINTLCPNSTTDKANTCFGTFPILTKRIVKVENFYVIIQVMNYEFYDDNKNTLKSMNIEVNLSNSYDGPRTSDSKWYTIGY
jgi:hypothetical protein